MVSICSEDYKIIRQYCIMKEVDIKKFLKEVINNDQRIVAFKEELRRLKSR